MTEGDSAAPPRGRTAARLAAALFRGFPGRIGAHYHGEMTVQINAAFDGGNIRVLIGVDGDSVDLEIVRDNDSRFLPMVLLPRRRRRGADGHLSHPQRGRIGLSARLAGL